MQKFQFVTIDTILAKYFRDFRGLDINTDDAIEWVGEALGFMKIVSASEEAVAFIEVKDYQATIPEGLHYIMQIARKTSWVDQDTSCNPTSMHSNLHVTQKIVGDTTEAIPEYTPYFNFPFKNLSWNNSSYTKKEFSNVRLADASFFNSLVCKIPALENLYTATSDEYTIVQDNLRFNFKQGFVAVSYVRQMIDCDTGYPMVPDDESAKSAITYYLGWKFKERECWNHREGSCQLAEKAESKWLKYVKQFGNKAKMPQGIDQYQNLLEASFNIVPNHRKYYGFFGKGGNNLQNENYTNNSATFANKLEQVNIVNNISESKDTFNTNDW